MGARRLRAFANHLQHPDRPATPPSPLCPLPSFLRRQEPTHPSVRLHPNSSLPPSRGEVRWGVGSHKPAPPAVPRPDRLAPGIFTRIAHSAPLPSTPALAARISPIPSPTPRLPPPPIHPSPPSRGEARWGVRNHKPAPPAVPRPDLLTPGIFTRIAHSARHTRAHHGYPAEPSAQAPNRRPTRPAQSPCCAASDPRPPRRGSSATAAESVPRPSA